MTWILLAALILVSLEARRLHREVHNQALILEGYRALVKQSDLWVAGKNRGL